MKGTYEVTEFCEFGPVCRVVILKIVCPAKLGIEVFGIDEVQHVGIESDLHISHTS